MANMRQGFQNVELIDKTIGSIKSRRFAMSRWDACICGHMARLLDVDVYSHDDPERWGGEVLGLRDGQVIELFCTNLEATREEAVRVLEILRDEGVVDWDRARDEVANEQLERMRIEFEDDRLPFANTLDELHAQFDRLVEKARALALTL